MIKEMMDSKVLCDSISLYAGSIMLVKKNDGSWRLGIDFRALK